jgi:hypothetical protein
MMELADFRPGIGLNQQAVIHACGALATLSKEIMLEKKCSPGDAIATAKELIDGVEKIYAVKMAEAKAKDVELKKRQRERNEKLRKLQAESVTNQMPLGGYGSIPGDEDDEIG